MSVTAIHIFHFICPQIKSRYAEGPETAVTTTADNVVADYFSKWLLKQQDNDGMEEAYSTPTWMSDHSRFVNF